MNHRQRILALTAAIAATATSAAWANGVDQAITQGGGSEPSGTWRTVLINAADELLLKFNNDMTFDMAVSLDPTAVLDYVPLQDRYQVGEIMYAIDDQTRTIYDRLAVRAVVYVIGYQSGQWPDSEVSPVMLLTENNDLLTTSGALSIPAGSGALPGVMSRQPRTMAVPEPATVALIGLGLMLLLPRRRRRQT